MSVRIGHRAGNAGQIDDVDRWRTKVDREIVDLTSRQSQQQSNFERLGRERDTEFEEVKQQLEGVKQKLAKYMEAEKKQGARIKKLESEMNNMEYWKKRIDNNSGHINQIQKAAKNLGEPRTFPYGDDSDDEGLKEAEKSLKVASEQVVSKKRFELTQKKSHSNQEKIARINGMIRKLAESLRLDASDIGKDDYAPGWQERVPERHG